MGVVIDYTKYRDGVTVIPSKDSPTGYLAVFVFDERSITEEYAVYFCRQYNVDIRRKVNLNKLAKIQIYSNNALLFTYKEQEKLTPLDPVKNAHDPWEFRDGMYPAGGNTDHKLFGNEKINYYSDMTMFAEGRWGTEIPLLAGCTDYNVRLIDEEGNTDGTYLFDPANPPMYNPLSGLYSRSSLVYVPYDAQKQPAYCDRTLENPRTDGVNGTLEFAEYEGVKGFRRYLAVYLPAHYARNREEPYKVIYISHGFQIESKGCEMRWFHECAIKNIMDHLETDYVVVSENNSDLLWNFDDIWEEQKRIFQFAEEKYHVSSAQKDRAYFGFSMGGLTASVMYMKHNDSFRYYGVWNAANYEMMKELTGEEKKALAGKDVRVQVAYGDWDYAMPLLDDFRRGLEEMGVNYDYLTVPGSHDWKCFALIFADSAKNFLFR